MALLVRKSQVRGRPKFGRYTRDCLEARHYLDQWLKWTWTCQSCVPGPHEIVPERSRAPDWVTGPQSRIRAPDRVSGAPHYLEFLDSQTYTLTTDFGTLISPRLAQAYRRVNSWKPDGVDDVGVWRVYQGRLQTLTVVSAYHKWTWRILVSTSVQLLTQLLEHSLPPSPSSSTTRVRTISVYLANCHVISKLSMLVKID